MALKKIIILWMVLVHCNGRKGPYGRNFVNQLCTGSANEVKKCKDIAVKCIVRPKLEPVGSNLTGHAIYCKTFDACLEQTNGTRAFYDAYLQERQGRNRCASRKLFSIKNETIPQAVNGTIRQAVNGTIPQAVNGTIPQVVNGTIPQSVNGTIPQSVNGTIPQAVNGTKIPSPTTQSKVNVKAAKGMTFEDYLVQVAGAKVAAQFVCCLAKANGKFNDNETVNVTAWKAETSTLEDITLKSVLDKSIDNCVTLETSCSVSDFKLCVITNCYNSIKQAKMNNTNATIKN